MRDQENQSDSALSEGNEPKRSSGSGKNKSPHGSTTNELEHITPSEAVEWYLNEHESDLSGKSLQIHRYRLRQFLEFCTEHGIEKMNTLTGRDLHRFTVWREQDIEPLTLRRELRTLCLFLRFCAYFEAVEPGVDERVKFPSLDTLGQVAPEGSYWVCHECGKSGRRL